MTRAARIKLAVAAAAVAAAPIVGVAYNLSGQKWAIRQLPYYVNPNNSWVGDAEALSAVQTAASAWSMQTNADVSLYYMGQTSGNSLSLNNKNEVFFRNTAPGALAEAYYWYDSTNTIREADIVVYEGTARFFAGSSGCASGYYIEDVVVHEFGHFMGLRHSDSTNATMYPYATQCSTSNRSLDSDDIAGIEALYPSSGGSSNTAPTVSISAPSSNSSYPQGTTVSFSGSASDKEDGNLSSSMTWHSSVDGYLGSGGSVGAALSAGSHVVTAQVSDSRGSTGSRTVSVTITAAPTNSAPSVNITAPSSNANFAAGAAIQFSGSASDQQDGNLSSSLYWQSSRDGYIGSGANFSKALSTGTHTIYASVTDRAGTSTTNTVSVTVNAVTNTPPVVSITSPAHGASFPQGSTITLTGSATDNQDGNISSKITWHSSIDGPLGMASSVSRQLSVGTHTISASVSDNAGAPGSAAIGIIVVDTASVPAPTPSPGSISLTATPGKSKGSQQVTLSWSGATSSNVDVYRDGRLVVTTVNDGRHTDSTGRKGAGTYTYTVCEAGTTACSAAVTVRF